MGWIRSLGAGLIRSHYPLNPQLEEMADRYGVLIWSEVPVYQVPTAQLADPAVLRHAHAILSENIATNQNHPSVMVWSIGNELPTYSTPSEIRYVAGATALAHRLDPTRPVALDIGDWTGVGCQPAYAPLDVLGINEYYGWFDAGAGATDDRDALGPFLDEAARLLSAQGAFHHRVRVRRQPSRPRRGTRHLRVPGQHDRLPPGCLSEQAVAVGLGVLDPAGLRRTTGLGWRQPVGRPTVRAEGLVRPPGQPQARVRDSAAGISSDAADRAAAAVAQHGRIRLGLCP